jgi:hypothetical protein
MGTIWKVCNCSDLFEKDSLIISGSGVQVPLGPLENKRLTLPHQIAKTQKGNTKVTADKISTQRSLVPKGKKSHLLFQ